MKRPMIFFTLLALIAWACATLPPSGQPGAVKVGASIGIVESVYRIKCSKCHGQDRPDKAQKSFEEWKLTVEAMRAKDPTWISEEEEGSIVKYLAGRDLFSRKCGKPCHSLSKSDKKKTALEWAKTVDQMQTLSSKSNINQEDKPYIVFYLIDTRLDEKP